MSKQDRLNLDLRGLREQIEGYRDTPEWKALAWSRRVRLLIEAGLKANVDREKTESVRRFITALSLKRCPSDDDLVIAAHHLNLPEEVLMALRDDQVNGKGREAAPNGA